VDTLVVFGYLKLLDTGESMPTAIKYSGKTSHCFMNAFPVFRVPSKLRQQLLNIMLEHKPKSMLYSLLITLGLV
jgi:hypothetical protein